MLVVAALLAVAGTGVVVTRRALAGAPAPRPSAAPSGTPSGGTQLQVVTQAAPSPSPTPVTVSAPTYLNFFGWTLLNRRTGQTTGSANQETANSTTESMIKVWITADYLRHQSRSGAKPSATVLNELTRMIVNSDDTIARKYYEINGGDASITELISTCGLRHATRPGLPDEWSYTMMAPADAVRLGACVANGTAAGPTWTDWLLDTMRKVTGGVADQQEFSGGGRWGIIDALPAATAAKTSIKNGWTPQVYDHNWHVNCLAINPDWILAIEMHYPWTSPDDNWRNATNLQQGADACKSVAAQVLTS
jgi:hypothetical protein